MKYNFFYLIRICNSFINLIFLIAESLKFISKGGIILSKTGHCYQFRIMIISIAFFISPISNLYSINTVILKNSDSLQGIVIGQNLDTLKLKTETGVILNIPKKKILKVLYKEITKKEIEQIRFKEEEKLRINSEKEKEIRKLAEQKKLDKLKKIRETYLSEGNKAYPKENLGLLSSYKIYNAYPIPILALASPEASCEPYAYSSDWYILFGIFRLTSPDMGELLPKESKLIQIRYETSLTDLAITLLGGIAFSLTKKTLYIDSCEDKIQRRIISEQELQLEKDAESKVLEELMKAKEKEELEDNIKLEMEIKKLEKIGQPK